MYHLITLVLKLRYSPQNDNYTYGSNISNHQNVHGNITLDQSHLICRYNGWNGCMFTIKVYQITRCRNMSGDVFAEVMIQA